MACAHPNVNDISLDGFRKNEFHTNAKIFKDHKLQLMYLVELLTVKKYLRCGRGNKVKGGFMQKESQNR